MKFWLSTPFLLIFCLQLFAQSKPKSIPIAVADTAYKRPCDCTVLGKGPRKFLPNEEIANKVVADLLKLVHQHSSLKYTDTIVVKEAGCGPPEARNCPTDLLGKGTADVPLILYNNVFLKGITRKDGPITKIDLHILSHEIGHHVFGHLKNTDGEAVFTELHGTDAISTNRISRRYRVSNRHAEEIQADFFGLWLLSLKEKNLDFDAFAADFNTDYIREFVDPDTVYSSTHPFFRNRIAAMRRFWPQLQIRKLQNTGISRGYFAKSATAAYIDVHPEHWFWDVGLVGGVNLAGKPSFSINSQPIDAMLYTFPNDEDRYGWSAGFSVSRFRWNYPLRYEAEITYSKELYSTTMGAGNTRQRLENFDLRTLAIFPKLTWSPTSKPTAKFSTNRFGFFFSGGFNIRIPLHIGYENHALTLLPNTKPSLLLTVNPRASVGIEFLKKTFLPRGYKLALNYEFRTLGLNTNANPTTVSHNVDLTLYYTLSRF
ncbi:hypothetical protein GCM10028807_53700 [Spirosoma daeguense]